VKTLLIADDEQQNVSVFHAALSAVGYQVETAPDGKRALEAIKQRKFDGIILDEMMPDMSGNDVVKAIKENEATKTIPIIILTNYGDDELVKQAMAQGATAYILKYQMTPNDLADKIKSIVGE
jgi:CheY-like chemotaxis protein